MSLKSKRETPPLLSDKIIWVLYPQIQTEDPDLQYYYDFSQSYLEYKKAFEELACPWIWQAVEINKIEETVQLILKKSAGKTPVVLNLCDGDEQNNIPGISVIRELDKHNIIYTGADEIFYDLTTSKIIMKRCFDQCKVEHSPWRILDPEKYSAEDLFNQLKSPIIVKPAVSAGSLGLSVHSVISSKEELHSFMNSGFRFYKNWDLYQDGVFAEEFIQGPEYTSLIVGSSDRPEDCIIFPPVERKFEDSLPEKQKFLSYDRLWEFYEHESPLENGKDLWQYAQVDPLLVKKINKLSLDAYMAVKARGYARIDLRMDKKSAKLYVLEVNSQCGLSEDENYTSIGAILRFNSIKFSELIALILMESIKSNQLKTLDAIN